VHGENIDAATAVQLAKTMIRDGQIPTPEEAERQLEERLERILASSRSARASSWSNLML